MYIVNSHIAKIAGHEVKIMTDKSAEDIQAMTDYINSITDDFALKKGANIHSSFLLSYACLSLCEELFKAKEELQKSRDELQEFIKEFENNK